jgi:hypothetical protein
MEFMGGSAQLAVPWVETEGTRRFGNKNKNSVFYFVFRSTCSTFGGNRRYAAFRKEKKKLRVFLCPSLNLQYLCSRITNVERFGQLATTEKNAKSARRTPPGLTSRPKAALSTHYFPMKPHLSYFFT